MKTVAQLKDGVAGLLSGTDLNNVWNLNGALERSARTVCQKADIPEASGRQAVVLYDGVYDYAAPSTIFGSAIVDFRPQGNSRSPLDEPYKKPVQTFDLDKKLVFNGYLLTMEWLRGVPVLRVATTKTTPKILIDPLSDDDDWTVGGSASALAVDETVYYEAPASLRFTLTGASSGYLEKTLDDPLDLTDYQGVGVVFVALYTPSAANLTSLNIRIGSDSANYYSASNTAGFLGAWTAGEWTLVALDLSAATTVGAPVITAMDYVRITAVHAATLTNFRLGYCFVSLPSPSYLLYQSSAIFMASGANPSTTITTDADQILLNDAAYNIYEHECALAIALQDGGSIASPLIASINQVLGGIRAPRTGAMISPGLYDLYRADNPSQEIK